jgi:hypothetical protein
VAEIAADGQTLSGQSAQTQADFQAVYGAGAADAWTAQHNAEIGAGMGAPAPPVGATPTATAPSATAPQFQMPDLSGLANFAAQTAGVTDKQLAQQKAEFDAQLAFARDQMEKLGIPQLQINQQLAALQQKQFEFQMSQAIAGMTGQFQGQPTMQALAQWAQLYGQNAPPTAGQPTLAAQAQQAVLSGMYQGLPTETAREFNANLAQQYLTTAAQLQGPQNTFQLSNYLRGAQGNENVPTYLQSLASSLRLPTFQASGGVAPTPQTAAGLAQQLGGGQSATPGWDYGQTLGTIQQIMQQGAQALRPGALESLTPAELQAFGSGLGALGGSLPEFLRQYAQSRYGQQAPVAMTTLG